MTMTVSRLHKVLGALIEAGHGRKPVLVDRSTFRDPRDNDGLLMLPPWEVQGPRWIPTADDDGGTKWNRDGTEAGRQCVVIVGDCAEPESDSGAPAGAPREQKEGSVHQAPPRNDQDCREGSDSSNAAPGAGGSAFPFRGPDGLNLDRRTGEEKGEQVGRQLDALHDAVPIERDGFGPKTPLHWPAEPEDERRARLRAACAEVFGWPR